MSDLIPVFYGHVTKGKIKLDRPDAYLVWLAGLEGKLIELTLRKERHARTLNQNRYYWGVVVELLSQHFGYDKDEMHEALKFKFLKKYEDSELPTVGSTTKLSTIDFNEYIEKVMRWAVTEHQIYIPEPNEVME